MPLVGAGGLTTFYAPSASKRGSGRYPPKKVRKAPGDADSVQAAAALEDADDAAPEEGDEDASSDGSASEGAEAGFELAQMADDTCDLLAVPTEPPADEPAKAEVAAAAPQAGPGPHLAAPPPPPPPPSEEQPRRGHRRQGAGVGSAIVVFRWGKIAFYESKNSFEAVCRNPAHGKCVLTRTAKARATAAGQMPKGGRPLGQMAAWLEQGGLPDKAAHWAAAVVNPSRAARSAARAAMAQNGPELLAFERPRNEALGEESEPEDGA